MGLCADVNVRAKVMVRVNFRMVMSWIRAALCSRIRAKVEIRLTKIYLQRELPVRLQMPQFLQAFTHFTTSVGFWQIL